MTYCQYFGSDMSQRPHSKGMERLENSYRGRELLFRIIMWDSRTFMGGGLPMNQDCSTFEFLEAEPSHDKSKTIAKMYFSLKIGL